MHYPESPKVTSDKWVNRIQKLGRCGFFRLNFDLSKGAIHAAIGLKLLILHLTSHILTYILATHLSNQAYDMCFRRASGKCSLCVSPTVIVAAPSITSQV